MSEKKLYKIIEVLTDKITSLENNAFLKDYEIAQLKTENARLNELLTPKAKGDKVNE